jgi:hypothetical protein
VLAIAMIDAGNRSGSAVILANTKRDDARHELSFIGNTRVGTYSNQSRLRATPMGECGAALSALPAASFTTSATSVVRIDANGLATGVSPGTATITGQVQDNDFSYASSTLVTVSAARITLR